MAIIFWLLLACTAISVDAQSDNNDHQVTIIISASVGVTIAVVFIIVCAGCIYHTRAVKKIRTKVWMRELIDCKHRHELIDTPDKLAPLENYFSEQEMDANRLFVAVIEDDVERKRTEETKERGLALDTMFTTECERRRVSDMLQAPDKVKQLYEETEMEIYETNVKRAYSDIDQQRETADEENTKSTIPVVKTKQTSEEIETANEKVCIKSDLNEKQEDKTDDKKSSASESSDVENEQNEEEETEHRGTVGSIYTETDKERNDSYSEKYINEIDVDDTPDINNETVLERNTVNQNENISIPHEKNVHKRKQAEFLSLPDIDQFFNMSTPAYHRKQKNKKLSKTRKINSKKIPNLRKHLKAIISGNSGHFATFGHKTSSKVLKIYSQRKSMTDISNNQDEEHRIFPSKAGHKEGFKSITLQPPSKSARGYHQSGVVDLRRRSTNKKTRKGSGYVQSASGIHQIRSLSRASNISQKSLTHISVTDIGINIGQT